jgi:hypothetical protein
MATQSIYSCKTAQDIDIRLTAGEITVEATDEVDAVEVVIRTADNEGPSADAVIGAKFREYADDVLEVRVKVEGLTISSNMVVFGGSFNGNVISGLNNISIVNGKIYSDGKEIYNNRAQQVQAHQGPSPVQVIIRMPNDRSLTTDTVSASLLAEGRFRKVDVKTTSGATDIEVVERVEVSTTSGSVCVNKATSEARVHSVSGSVKIRHWEGSALRVNTVSGSVKVINAEKSTGSITADTVSGSIRLGGTGHLSDRSVSMRTVSGSRSRS